MASSQFLCNPYHPPSFNCRKPRNLCRNSSLSAFWGHGYCSFSQKLQFRTTHVVRAMASDSQNGRKQVEITYDPDERISRFVDEADKNSGLSRLTLFSPCKINVFLRITKKREDGYHDLASLFHVSSSSSSSPSHFDKCLNSNNPAASRYKTCVHCVARQTVTSIALLCMIFPIYNHSFGKLYHSTPYHTNIMLCFNGRNVSSLQVISLGDIIKFSLSPSKTKDRLSTTMPGIPLDETNLIIKALNLYRKKTGSDKFFWIHLDKKVPTGAGLGGGSSNAATALWAANQFNGCVASEKELQEWSSEIGSDIPFFFSHGAAYCTGRGEIVQDIPPPIPLDMSMVLIKPEQACPTAEVYKRLRLDQTSKVDPLILLEKVSENGISQDVCINDLEPPAFDVLPSLKKLKQRVLAAGRGQYDAVFMSGSGSTIIGIGSPDPPQFIYNDDDYKGVFLSEASFLTREENQWYAEPSTTMSSCDSPADERPADDLSSTIQ